MVYQTCDKTLLSDQFCIAQISKDEYRNFQN